MSVIFIPSSELASVLNSSKGGEMSQSETVGPEWQRIAPAAQIPTQEIARLFIQAVISIAV